MPLYEGRCSAHGTFEEILSVNEYVLNAGLNCPECGHHAKTIIAPVRTIGPMPSKPLVIDQIGQTFHSKAEQRAYFDKHPNRRIVDPSDSSFVALKDNAREAAETAAKKLGFRDHDDRRAKVRKAKAHQKAIKSGDHKVQAEVG
jgi:putative FmdB family regulatory protein